MSQIAPLFTQKTVKRRAPESYKVAYKKKKHTVTVSYDYTSWKTDDILLQALARQRQTPPFQNVIGQGPAWPGKEKALALIKAHDKKRDGVVATGAAVAATGSQSALVLGGTATGAVPRLKPPDEAGIVFHPHRLMHESDEESCSSNDSFVRAQRERVAVDRASTGRQ
ncbi:hypothetical protein DIPPA_18285 [Diplonema papillatum]|nr:hypothetical protein DIPPA_18285 [Diplonema papillatum]